MDDVDGVHGRRVSAGGSAFGVVSHFEIGCASAACSFRFDATCMRRGGEVKDDLAENREFAVTAYIIVDMGAVAPEDAGAWKAYVAMAPATIEQYGGRYLARGGAIDVMEGEWPPHGIVIVEFPDREAAARWYASAEYAPGLKIRANSGLTRRMICVEGASDASPVHLLGPIFVRSGEV